MLKKLRRKINKNLQTSNSQERLEIEAYRKYRLRKKLGITKQVTVKELEMIQNGAKQCSEDQDEIEDNVKVTDNIIEEFWFRRHQEARRWVWVICVSNLLYQVMAIAKPRNANHFWVNVGYTAIVAVILTLVMVSYKSKKLSVLVLPAMFLVQIR